MGGRHAGDRRMVSLSQHRVVVGRGVAVLYLLLRDGIGGQSLGKLLVGLVVINVPTGRLCTWKESALRNVFVLIPGANVVAIVLESITLIRDPQGQRLGDRLAQNPGHRRVRRQRPGDVVRAVVDERVRKSGARSRRRRRQPADSRRNQESGIMAVDLPVRRSSSR